MKLDSIRSIRFTTPSIKIACLDNGTAHARADIDELTPTQAGATDNNKYTDSDVVTMVELIESNPCLKDINFEDNRNKITRDISFSNNFFLHFYLTSRLYQIKCITVENKT